MLFFFRNHIYGAIVSALGYVRTATAEPINTYTAERL